MFWNAEEKDRFQVSKSCWNMRRESKSNTKRKTYQSLCATLPKSPANSWTVRAWGSLEEDQDITQNRVDIWADVPETNYCLVKPMAN